MNSAHLHLILTHLPIVTTFLSLLLIVYAMRRKDPHALDIALVGFLFAGVVALPVFWSGEAAEETVEHLPGIMDSAIGRHGDAAAVAVVLALIVAGLASVTLFMRKRHMPLADWGQRAVVLAGVVAILAMGWTANLGGRISHPEISGNVALQQNGGEAGDEGKALGSGKGDHDDDDHGKKRGGKDDD